MESKATAVWRGSLKEGTGSITTGSGTIKDTAYTFKTRFEGEKGTNPEELIAAAPTSCFSMALSAELGKASITQQSIETSGTIVLAQQGQGFAVTDSKLVTVVTAPGNDRAAIEAAAASAKENCPISKLVNTKISLELTINT